jgi:hypothetical protein
MRFTLGEKVSYTGTKHRSDLAGKLGEIVGRVTNSETGVVVSFGGKDAYICDEMKHLSPFQGHIKGGGDGEKSEKKDDKVQYRRTRKSKQEDSE